MFENISQEALQQVDLKYGAEPFTPQTTLTYHNGLHTRNVIKDFDRLATILPLNEVARSIGSCAAAAHDVIQGTGRHNDEQASANWLATRLTSHATGGYVEMAHSAIVGTEPIFADGVLASQVASHQEYPTRQHELVAKALASADLGHLFQPEGPYMAHLLFQEINGNQPPEQITDVIGFQASQLELFDRYHYPLTEASTLVTHQKAVCDYTEAVLADIQSGKLESWQQLLDSDREFMDRHR